MRAAARSQGPGSVLRHAFADDPYIADYPADCVEDSWVIGPGGQPALWLLSSPYFVYSRYRIAALMPK